jgi:hypothetical protein
MQVSRKCRIRNIRDGHAVTAGEDAAGPKHAAGLAE